MKTALEAIKKKIHRLKRTLYYENGVSKLGYPPLEIFIEPTSHCNLSCPMCPQSKGLKRNSGFMDMSLYGKIIEDAKKSGISRVSLFMGGESLLHKGIVEMIKTAKSAGMKTRLHTNATVLTEKLSEEIIRSGLDEISFSFDGETKERFEKLRKGANFVKVLSNIKTFLEYKKDTGSKTPYTIIQVIKDYEKEKPKICEEFKALFAGLPVDSFKPILLQSFAGHLKGKDFNYIPYTSHYTPCPQIWQRFVIGWDGRAIACCVDLDGKNIIGDAKKQTISEIWNGPEFIRLRQKLINKEYNDLEACKNCDFLWRAYRKKREAPLKRLAKKVAWKILKPQPVPASATLQRELSTSGR